ncbi:MAG: DUF423 domain-containing protein [Flavicella sp.]
MNEISLIIGASYGALGIAFGAFGAHALKKTLNETQLKNFETGVKYQMYHALLLIVLGLSLEISHPFLIAIQSCISIGIFLFSFSIYGLVLSAAKGKTIKFLGPITPIGGLLLLVGWALLAYSFSL